MKILMKPIDMICLHEKDGTLIPIRFKISQEGDDAQVVKIDRVISQSQEKLAGNPMQVFKVQSIINQLELIFEIKYEHRTAKWYLYKM